MKVKNSALAALILAGALSRLIPHAPNFTAIVAMALLAGASLNSRILSIFVPIAALFVSDLFLGLHEGMYAVYGTMAVIALVANSNLKVFDSWKRSGFAALGASFFFYLTTNFAVWMTSGMYQKSFQGLLNCYFMAVPFLAPQILGDLFFTAIAFAAARIILSGSPSKSYSSL